MKIPSRGINGHTGEMAKGEIMDMHINLITQMEEDIKNCNKGII